MTTLLWVSAPPQVTPLNIHAVPLHNSPCQHTEEMRGGMNGLRTLSSTEIQACVSWVSPRRSYHIDVLQPRRDVSGASCLCLNSEAHVAALWCQYNGLPRHVISAKIPERLPKPSAHGGPSNRCFSFVLERHGASEVIHDASFSLLQ